MFKLLSNLVLRRGLETAAQVGLDAAATATGKSFIQRFNVKPPVTVFVRGSNVAVRVIHQAGNIVELNASLRASFGWEFATEQDEAGVYIVAKRKPLVGTLSSASFTIIAPPEAALVLHLTPGSVQIVEMNGKLTIPAGMTVAPLSTLK
jgi:hypothetical protein